MHVASSFTGTSEAVCLKEEKARACLKSSRSYIYGAVAATSFVSFVLTLHETISSIIFNDVDTVVARIPASSDYRGGPRVSIGCEHFH